MRILIADDDAISRLMLNAIATKLGHDCLTASDGSSAWQLLSTHGIDVLLTDWMMPGLDGPQLCKRVREELTDNYIYIVLITGQQRPEQVMEGMNAGADDYLIKPIYPFGVQTRLIAAERVTTSTWHEPDPASSNKPTSSCSPTPSPTRSPAWATAAAWNKT